MRIPKKPSGRKALPFYWYRRFKAHKYLPYKYPLIDKIKNSDFEYSPFFDQAKWELHWMEEEQKEFIDNYQGKDPTMDMLYTDIEVKARKRYNKLYEDAMKDEHNRMDSLIINLSKHYKLKKEKVKDFVNGFDGTTIELFESLKYE
jgi:hypothetical protein